MLLVTMQGCKEALEERGLVVEAMAELVHGSLAKRLFHPRGQPLEVVVEAELAQLIMGKMVSRTQQVDRLIILH